MIQWSQSKIEYFGHNWTQSKSRYHQGKVRFRSLMLFQELYNLCSVLTSHLVHAYCTTKSAVTGAYGQPWEEVGRRHWPGGWTVVTVGYYCQGKRSHLRQELCSYRQGELQCVGVNKQCRLQSKAFCGFCYQRTYWVRPNVLQNYLVEMLPFHFYTHRIILSGVQHILFTFRRLAKLIPIYKIKGHVRKFSGTPIVGHPLVGFWAKMTNK